MAARGPPHVTHWVSMGYGDGLLKAIRLNKLPIDFGKLDR